MKEYNLFIDESGDHGLSNINEDFPVFVLCGILSESTKYENIRKAINDVKEIFWHDKKVIFHSRDIRKCEKEFVILFDDNKKKDFYNRINEIFTLQEYFIIASAINKINYVEKHGRLGNDVYEISLSFLLDKSIEILKGHNNEPFELKIYIERRGKSEDQKLSEHFQRIKSRGTAHLDAETITDHISNIEFKNKSDDINGLQLADLAAYPIARYIIDKKRANPAFDILKEKIYSNKDTLSGIMEYP